MVNNVTRRRATANDYQGMNWIRPAKRLAIYMRDGLACCYCGEGVEEGAVLTLDHFKPYSKGGSNHESNLFTACRRCNSSRGTRSVAGFCKTVVAYIGGRKADDVLTFIMNTRRRTLDVTAAKALIAARGGFTAAVRSSN